MIHYFGRNYKKHFLHLLLIFNYHLKFTIMAKGQDSRKNVKKEPAKTAKEKRAAKKAKKANK